MYFIICRKIKNSENLERRKWNKLNNYYQNQNDCNSRLNNPNGFVIPIVANL